ncbi:hypothetical protein RGQ29_012555 [Quercus rubra]|uniref:Uncharacterized protein n=1 Tax=Quercus rubra TaxID=3512 RepID=A0AAN7J9G9_QUERU|nr:hypothetical protein RGQ29_012555 [Quercus rubra]KAK4604089.1 hypothetical protein RGQ29_012555 [Quercus rubra]
MYMETRLAHEHGRDGCYTFGAVGEAEVVNAQGGCGLLQQWDVLASVLNCIGDHVLMGSLCSWL